MLFWPDFEHLLWDLATGNFQPESVTLLGDFKPQIPAPWAPSLLAGNPDTTPTPALTKTQGWPQQAVAQNPPADCPKISTSSTPLILQQSRECKSPSGMMASTSVWVINSKGCATKVMVAIIHTVPYCRVIWGGWRCIRSVYVWRKPSHRSMLLK